jgi:4-hydroxybenzoate polyprenyltransferase
LLWQVATLRVDDGTDALAKFRSNRVTGLLVALAMITIGASA